MKTSRRRHPDVFHKH